VLSVGFGLGILIYDYLGMFGFFVLESFRKLFRNLVIEAIFFSGTNILFSNLIYCDRNITNAATISDSFSFPIALLGIELFIAVSISNRLILIPRLASCSFALYI